MHSLFRLRSLVWFVFQWKPLLFSTASQFGEMGAHSITRAQAPLSTLVFGGWAAGFSDAPNSILFGVCCQPERGRKQKRERANRRMNQCVCLREGERERETARGQNDKNKPALVRVQAGHLMAKSIKPWWKAYQHGRVSSCFNHRIPATQIAQRLLEHIWVKSFPATTKQLRSTQVITKGQAENIHKWIELQIYASFNGFSLSNFLQSGKWGVLWG